MGRRCADGDYARFVEATVELADAALSLPRRPRFALAVAILRTCESERVAQVALGAAETRRLHQAAARLRQTRELLAEALRTRAGSAGCA